MNELRPCPFCGRLPNIVERKTQKSSFFCVECKNINCQILVSTLPCKTEETAIEAWNRRTNDENPGRN